MSKTLYKHSPKKQKNHKNSKLEASQPRANMINEKEEEILTNKEISKYIREKRELYENIIQYIENPTGDYQNDLNHLNVLLDNQKQEENREKLEQLLRLISCIADNHERSEFVFRNICELLKFYQDKIKELFSNIDLFNIFENNKAILLFLFDTKIITIDAKISNEKILLIEEYKKLFFPEIKVFLDKEKIAEIEKDISSIDSFDQKRHEGENDSYVCYLIRQDAAEDFITYVNQTNLSLNSQIKYSIFETNPFLIENGASLIEYAAFFGSITIFQFLRLNNVELTPSLWLYAIHSNNAELIHLLEQNKVDPSPDLDKQKYERIFIESIKCHHNEIAEYIKANYLDDQNENEEKNEDILSTILQSHNYSYFPSNFTHENDFYHLVINDYHKLSNLFLKRKQRTINQMMHNNTISLQKAANENLYDVLYYLLLFENQIPNCFFKGNKNLKRIIIPSTIKVIGKEAFRECSALKQVTIPSSVTQIRQYTFYKCESLEQITIPSSVTEIARCAFAFCSSLKNIKLPYSLKEVGRETFDSCELLEQVVMPNVTQIRKNTFRFCNMLRQITINKSLEISSIRGELVYFNARIIRI
ncbi:hypothetical protein M9Y10_036722 [Tritrichomonas musculus]|uniref:DUF3447 domain-containing protein n=1 Tax=Tritrichomonas musculus TaxID=1915356 RepID=A0ABR2GTL8_9EUKA